MMEYRNMTRPAIGVGVLIMASICVPVAMAQCPVGTTALSSQPPPGPNDNCTAYELNFTASSGIDPSPGFFTYDRTNGNIYDLNITWDGIAFSDLTATANDTGPENTCGGNVECVFELLSGGPQHSDTLEWNAFNQNLHGVTPTPGNCEVCGFIFEDLTTGQALSTLETNPFPCPDPLVECPTIFANGTWGITTVPEPPLEFPMTTMLLGAVAFVARKRMNQTGHRSVQMVRRYIRDGNLFRENSAGKARFVD
jgi:hypothetical protein